MSSQHQFVSFGDLSAPQHDKQWLWHGILMPGKLTLLTSLWKSGKTTLLAHLLAQRRRGGEFLGLKVRSGISIVVSEEPRDLWPQRNRQHDFGSELSIVTRPFAGRPTVADLEALNHHLLEYKAKRGLDLVVFDSLAYFLPARSENEAGSMANGLAPFIALAEQDISVFLLHHPSKGEPALGEAARGSGALLASVDIFMEMRHPGGNPFSRRRRIFGWSRHDETPRQMLIELSPDGKKYERLGDTSDDFHTNWDLLRLVFAENERPLTRAEIRAHWPASLPKPHDATLWRWLDRAVELGLAVRQGRGTRNEPFRFGLALST
jgi:hypothetical protein